MILTNKEKPYLTLAHIQNNSRKKAKTIKVKMIACKKVSETNLMTLVYL